MKYNFRGSHKTQRNNGSGLAGKLLSMPSWIQSSMRPCLQNPLKLHQNFQFDLLLFMGLSGMLGKRPLKS